MEIAPLPAWKRSRRQATSRGGASGKVFPGVAFVPDEVVQYGGLHGEGGGHHVVEVERAEEQREGAHLHHDTEGADRVEFEPADGQRRHGRRSAS